MQSLAAHLKRKNLKILEQQLSLPKIPEKVPMHTPQTSARSRKTKPALKYVSQTTLSPQQQHLQDQIRLVLHKETRNFHQNIPTPQLIIKRDIKRQRKLLPKIKNGPETPRKETQNPPNQDKSHAQLIGVRKARSNGKFDLESILRNQSQFMQNYFAEIASKVKK